MPSATRIQRFLGAQEKTGQTINRLLLTVLGLAAASLLTLGIPDSYLLDTATTVNVPFAGAASFKVLLVVLPMILIAARTYLQFYVSHWHRLERITQRFHMRRAPVLSPLRHPLLRIFSGFVLYALIPAVLCALSYEAMVFPGWGPALLGVATVLAFLQLAPARWSLRVKSIIPALLFLGVVFGPLDSIRRPFQLTLANLQRTDLSHIDLLGADLDRADLREANLGESLLEGAYLSEANLEGANMVAVDLSGANLWKANLKDVRLQNANLEGAFLAEANLEGSYLWITNLSNAVLNNANLKDTYLGGANLQDADLEGVNLEGAKLVDVDYSGADFREVTGLTQEQLDTACGNAETQLPKGLTVKPCVERIEDSPLREP